MPESKDTKPYKFVDEDFIHWNYGLKSVQKFLEGVDLLLAEANSLRFGNLGSNLNLVQDSHTGAYYSRTSEEFAKQIWFPNDKIVGYKFYQSQFEAITEHLLTKLDISDKSVAICMGDDLYGVWSILKKERADLYIVGSLSASKWNSDSRAAVRFYRGDISCLLRPETIGRRIEEKIPGILERRGHFLWPFKEQVPFTEFGKGRLNIWG